MKKRSKRSLSLLCVLLLVATLLPAEALAEDPPISVGGVPLAYTNTPVYATTSDAGVVTKVDYIPTDNYVKFEVVEGTPTLTLHNATIVSASGTGNVFMAISATGNLTILLEGVNRATAGDNDYSYGILVQRALTIAGDGALTAAGGAARSNSYGITTGDGGSITISGGTVTALGGAAGSTSAGLDCSRTGASCTVTGGILVAVGGTGIAPHGINIDSLTVSGIDTKVIAVGGTSASSIGINASSSITYNGGLLVAKGGRMAMNKTAQGSGAATPLYGTNNNTSKAVVFGSAASNPVITENQSLSALDSTILIGVDKIVDDTTALTVSGGTLACTGFNVVLAGDTATTSNSYAISGATALSGNGFGVAIAGAGAHSQALGAAPTNIGISQLLGGDWTGKVAVWGPQKSTTPTATITTVAKTTATQTSVVFNLTNDPAYVDGLGWEVCNGQGIPLADVDATYNHTNRELTLTSPTNLPAGVYYVSVTETDKAESDHLALTVTSPAESVTLYPTDGSSGVTLNSTNPYFVNNAAATTGTLGENGCTAYFHADSGILELQGFDLNGAGSAASNIYSGIYSQRGDLTILLHGDNSVQMTDNLTSGRYARAIFVKDGSLTIGGSGSLTVETGNGYGSPSAAVSCNSTNACLTVARGVTLNAAVGTPSASSGDNQYYGIYAARLINHGQITATGRAAGIYLNSASNAASEIDGSLTATGSVGSGLILGGDDILRVSGGTVELTGSARNPAIGSTTGGNGIFTLEIGSAITGGLLGTDNSTASTFSSGDIPAACKSTNPVYSYLRLPAPAPSVPVYIPTTPTVTFEGGLNGADGGTFSFDLLTGTLTITPSTGYTIKDVLLGGDSQGPVTELKKLNGWDRVKVIVEPIPAKTPEELAAEQLAARQAKLKAGVKATTIEATARFYSWKKSGLLKKGMRVAWSKSPGYKVDFYEIWRLDADTGKYVYLFKKKSGLWYINTKDLIPGKRFTYKVRGVRRIGGETVRTQWSNTTKATFK